MPVHLAPPQSGPTSSSTPPTVLCTCTGVHHLPLGSPDKFCWTPDDLAAALDISVRSLTNLRSSDPTFPAPRMLGTLPRWSPETIHRWLNEASAATAAPAAAATQPAAQERAPVPAGPNGAGAKRRRTPIGNRPTNAAAVDGSGATTREGAAPAEVWHV